MDKKYEKPIPLTPWAVHNGVYTVISRSSDLAKIHANIISEPERQRLVRVLHMVLPRQVLSTISIYDMDRFLKVYKTFALKRDIECIIAAMIAIVYNYPAQQVFDKCHELGLLDGKYTVQSFIGRVMSVGFQAAKTLGFSIRPTNPPLYYRNTAYYICRQKSYEDRFCDIVAAATHILAETCGKKALKWARSVIDTGKWVTPECGCVVFRGNGSPVLVRKEDGCAVVLANND